MTSSNKQKNKPPAPPSNPWLGIDIGGANLKLALCGSAGTPTWAASIPFPMWKQSEQLATTLATCIDDCPEFHAIALTMTGELADCFATRAEGVAKILEQVTRLFPRPTRLRLRRRWAMAQPRTSREGSLDHRRLQLACARQLVSKIPTSQPTRRRSRHRLHHDRYRWHLT